MAKTLQSKSKLSVKEKTKQQTKKYTCGCGKQYTSYPAYSTHRKTKHNNVDIEGTYIPKCQNPKRGRPSYQFVKKNEGKMEQIKNYYQGLTVIELGLLKLNQRFQGKILSQSHQSNRFSLPDQLVTIASHDSDRTKGENLIFDIGNLENLVKRNSGNHNALFLAQLMILFVQLMTTHMTQTPAQALIDFITEFIIYVSSSQKASINSEDDELDSERRDLMNISLFNDYFSRQQNKEHINKLSIQYNLKPEYFVTLSVILSHWIYKLGYCDKVIKVRSPASSQIKSATY